MLDQNTFKTLAEPRAERRGHSGLTVWDIVDALRHHKFLILTVTILTTALGAVYAITSPPRYSASSQVIMDTRGVADLTIDTTFADSQVEVLKSEAVTLAVIESLDLLKDPEFTETQTSVTRSFLERFGLLPPDEDTASNPVSHVLGHLRQNLSVRRVGRTFVLEVSFLSRSRDTAIKVANAVVKAYIFDQVRSSISVTTEANARLEAEFVSRYGENHPAVAEIRKNIQSLRDASREEIKRAAAAFQSFPGRGCGESHDGARPARGCEGADDGARRHEVRAEGQAHPRNCVVCWACRRCRPGANSAAAGLLYPVGLQAGGVDRCRMFRHGARDLRPAGETAPTLGCEERYQEGGHGDLTHEGRAGGGAVISKGPDRRLSDLTLERHAVHTPFSEFAEALRRLKVASDMSTPRPVILGFVSTTAGEGASFMAVNFAQLLASDGSDTLLIDGDLRSSDLSKRIAPEAKTGLAQLLETDAALDDLIWTDQVTGLAFLPTGTATALANSATILGSQKVEAFLSAARLMYQYIVIDLPPMDKVVDAKVAGEIIDRFVLVTAWGRTSRHRVETVLRSAEVIRTRLIGGLLNRADARRHPGLS